MRTSLDSNTGIARGRGRTDRNGSTMRRSRVNLVTGRLALLLWGCSDGTATDADSPQLAFDYSGDRSGAFHAQGPRPANDVGHASDPYTTMLKSRDPDHPGVIWLGDRLRIGDYDVLDGAGGDNLSITWYSKRGFGGSWTSDMGFAVVIDSLGRMLPNPAGYFCARRLDAAS
jgi:hypothetical protein